MRILFCNYEYPPLGGGGGVINALLAEELATRHDVTILTSQGMDLPAEEVTNGVRIIRVPVFFRSQTAAANFPSMLAYLPMGIRAGKRLIRKEKFDIINTHFALPTGPVGDALSKYGGIPNVLSVHGGDLYDPSKKSSPHRHALLRMWVRRLLRSAYRVVGQSRNTVDNVHEFYDASLETDRIPLGIRRPPTDIGSRQDYNFTDNDILLVTVGRLVSRKAIDQLISVMKSLKQTSAHLLIIGTGPQEQALRDKANQLQVSDRVHFLGNVDEQEKFRVLHMSDIFVSTSQHEGFGLVFLEAMASGLPVICYDHGGQTDFLVNKTTGYMLKLNDQQAFTEGCLKLVNDADMRSSMAAENQKRVEELYIDKCAQQYEALFQKVIEEKR